MWFYKSFTTNANLLWLWESPMLVRCNAEWVPFIQSEAIEAATVGWRASPRPVPCFLLESPTLIYPTLFCVNSYTLMPTLLHSNPDVMEPSDSPWVAFDSRGNAFFRPAHFSERVPPCPSCFSPSSPPSPFCTSCGSTPAPCSSCYSPSSPPSSYCLSCQSSSTERGKSRNTGSSSIKEIKRKKPLFMNIPPTKELTRKWIYSE